ncbi:MAG: class IV adenylate cyclase [Thermoanaerobaculia bacterium]
MKATGTETEIKIPVADPESLRARLRESSAVETRGVHDEDNTLYDDTDGRLARIGGALRLRVAGNRGVLTLKGRARFEGNLKVREELETEVGEPEVLRAILARLGFVPRFRYQKRRQELELLGCNVCLDETPIGCFVEVEGEADRIAETLARLGLNEGDAEKDSYPGLYARARQRDPSLPPDMLFSR